MKSSLTVYKASAGSGKTFTLAVQYIKLLIAGDSNRNNYSQILAVTFTNKATAEMKDRILQQLYGIWKSLPSSEQYMQCLKTSLREEGVTLSDEEIRHRAGTALNRILHDYSRFRVETIDSFFQSVMKNLAHELNLTANLKINLHNEDVLGMAVDRILERLHLTPMVMSWILEYVNDRIANNNSWNFSGDIKKFSQWIFKEEYLAKEKELLEVLKDNKTVTELRKALHELQQSAVDIVISGAEHFREELESYGIACETFCRGSSLNTYLNKLSHGELSPTFGSTLEKYIQNPAEMLKKSDRNDAGLMQVAQHFSELLTELRKLQLSGARKHNSATLSLSFLNPLRLLGVITEEVNALNHENNSFLLAQTPILLNNLIENNDAPFIFEKMGTMFQHVMIDEFQDTSALQWSNFKLLLEERMAYGSGNLIVGDIKQSIYRWRNGDWRILKDIEREMGKGNTQLRNLKTNFRSEVRVIKFNNAMFEGAASAIDNMVPNADIKVSEAYNDVRQEWPSKKKENGYVRIRLFDKKEKDIDDEDIMLDELCEQVSLLHSHGVPYSEMAILIRKKRLGRPIINRFAQKLKDVKLVSDEAFLLSGSLSINILINAMRWMVQPDDRIPLAFLVLYATEGGISETHINQLTQRDLTALLPEEFVSRKEELLRMPLYELQEELFRIFRLERIPNQDAYLFAYFDQVTLYLQENPSDLNSFLRFWDEGLCNQSIPSGEIDGIRVLTVHKSKGLQYHTVFVPYCDWEIERDKTGGTSRNELLWCEPHEVPYNTLPILPVHISGSRMQDSIYDKDYEQEHLQRRVDAINTLYVAFTRAEKNLYAWGRTQYALTAQSGVGDLIFSALPTFEDDIRTVENDKGFIELYEYGTPVYTCKAQQDTHDNRMEIDYTPQTVSMHSFDTRIEFCQSNKAREFMESMSGTTDAGRQDEKRRTGILLHKIFSTIYTRNDIKKALHQLETEGLIASLPEKEELKQQVEKAFTLPEVALWFDGSMQLYNECPILTQEYNEEKYKFRSYRPDRVMFGTDTIIVVDFKFGSHHKEYREQVTGYMKQLRLMEPDKRIKGYLWYILSNELEEVFD